jgi:hypothetical protein
MDGNYLFSFWIWKKNVLLWTKSLKIITYLYFKKWYKCPISYISTVEWPIYMMKFTLCIMFRFIVFYATSNSISVISWRSFFIGEGNRSIQRKPLTCRKSLTNCITYCCIKYTSGFELTTLVVIGTDTSAFFVPDTVLLLTNTCCKILDSILKCVNC